MGATWLQRGGYSGGRKGARFGNCESVTWRRGGVKFEGLVGGGLDSQCAWENWDEWDGWDF